MSAHLSVTLRNALPELARIQSDVAAFLSSHGADAATDYAVQLAVEELVSNVIRHGYDDQELHEIFLSLTMADGAVDVSIEDDGRPFDPNRHPDLTTPRSLADAPVGGMGIHLVRQLAGPIRYERAGGLNRVRLRVGG